MSLCHHGAERFNHMPFPTYHCDVFGCVWYNVVSMSHNYSVLVLMVSVSGSHLSYVNLGRKLSMHTDFMRVLSAYLEL